MHLSIDHVQLPIPADGVPAARPFYEEVLGLREVRDPALDRAGTVRYALGPLRLDLSEGAYAGPAPQAHLALVVTDFVALLRRLQRAGVLLRHAPLADRDRAYVEDPFGNQLELIAQPREVAADGPHALSSV